MSHVPRASADVGSVQPLPDPRNAVVVRGLTETRRALKRTEATIDTELRGELRTIAREVADKGKANISHRTGRHGDPRLPHLDRTLRVSVTQKQASVYS